MLRVERRKLSGREKNEADVKLLESLRQRLFFNDASARRCAAFKLSWMQEDGLDIFTEALFRNDAPITAKYAAAYGLRSMNGRMRKVALQVITDGLNHPSGSVREVCSHTLSMLEERKHSKAARPLRHPARFAIKDVPRKSHKPRVDHRKPVLVHNRLRVR
jgi:hypothetical protein